MARIRSLKPEAFQSETLASVSLAAERTFFGLSTQVDDRGRIADKPAVINGAIWAVRAERELHTAKDLEAELDELVAEEAVCRYVGCDGKRYLHLVRWDDHQKVDRPGKSRLPRCSMHSREDYCGKHEGPCSPRESFARTRESASSPRGGDDANSRALDSHQTGQSEDPPPLGAIGDLDGEGEISRDDNAPSVHLPDQQKESGSRESREPSMLDLGSRTLDRGSTTPPTPAESAASGDGVLIHLPVPEPGNDRKPPELGSDQDLGFVAFWDVYPRKVGKPSARAAWKKAVGKARADPAVVIDAAKRYAANPMRRARGLEYTAHPATWLNDERYNDQPDQDEARGWDDVEETTPGEFNRR